LSNPVPWQNWMAAYLGYTLRMRTLFRDQLWLMTRIREEEGCHHWQQQQRCSWMIDQCGVCRYILIVHPMKAKLLCTMSSTYKTIAAVWAASLLLSSPTLHIMVRHPFTYLSSLSCSPLRKTDTYSRRIKTFRSQDISNWRFLSKVFVGFKSSADYPLTFDIMRT